jgi:ethanolamine utilization protein EutA
MHDVPWGHAHENAEAAIQETVTWTTVGIDVGSSTAQIVFSQVVHERREQAYVLSERKLLHQSAILLTPYKRTGVIDGAALKDFFAREYEAAGLSPSDVDTGAVILTGLALESGNARMIAQAIASEAGKFVAISAGDVLEARLAASGVGLATMSREQDGFLVHIDVGGGTSKVTRWKAGALVDLTAIDIGARHIIWDTRGRLTYISPPALAVAGDLGLETVLGRPLDPTALRKFVVTLAYEILCHAGAIEQPPRWPRLLRLDPLPIGTSRPSAIVFSGGIAEFIYCRETSEFGDMGKHLGRALREAVEDAGIPILPSESGIRATVRGVSQHSVQLSGVTIFISDRKVLPLRNIPIVCPTIDLNEELPETTRIAQSVRLALADFTENEPVALALTWEGSATHERLVACALGLVAGMDTRQGPIVVVVKGDVAGVLGANLTSVSPLPVVVLDSIELNAFDHLDIGGYAGGVAGVPVVIKSLLFAHTT